MTPPSDHRQSLGGAVRESEEDDVVPVVICASEERMGATMATINSIISNTDASVFFYIVTLRDAVKLTRCATGVSVITGAISRNFVHLILFFFHFSRRYIEKTKLKGIWYKILEFNPMVLKGKVKPDSSRPDLLHPVSVSPHN